MRMKMKWIYLLLKAMLRVRCFSRAMMKVRAILPKKKNQLMRLQQEKAAGKKLLMEETPIVEEVTEALPQGKRTPKKNAVKSKVKGKNAVVNTTESQPLPLPSMQIGEERCSDKNTRSSTQPPKPHFLPRKQLLREAMSIKKGRSVLQTTKVQKLEAVKSELQRWMTFQIAICSDDYALV